MISIGEKRSTGGSTEGMSRVAWGRSTECTGEGEYSTDTVGLVPSGLLGVTKAGSIHDGSTSSPSVDSSESESEHRRPVVKVFP